MAFEDLKPTTRIVVSGIELTVDVLDAVISVDVDLTRDLADQIKVVVANPRIDALPALNGRPPASMSSDFSFIDSKIWLPGNQIDVHLGYGKTTHVCSGIINKWLPSFPMEGIPTIEIVALDASTRLMDADTAAEAANYQDFDLDSIVRDILFKHDIDVGEVTQLVGSFQKVAMKKSGMTDYQFVKGLANLAGFEFKVRFDDFSKRWKGYWRPPTSDQTKKFTFTYSDGNGALLSFDPQWGLRDAPSQTKVLYFDKSIRIWQEVPSDAVSSKVADQVFGKSKKKPSGKQEDFTASKLNELVYEGLQSLEKIRIGTGGVSVEIVPERPFETVEAAEMFAARWIRMHRDNFITGRGTLIGMETLKPGDIHEIAGIGVLLGGDWELTTIRHRVDTEKGFVTEFSGNKVIDL